MTDHYNMLVICKRFFALITGCILLSCSDNPSTKARSLQEELYSIVDDVPGMVGIAFLSDTDTVTVNNGVHYPMMSVFKMHEALAVADRLESHGTSIDSVMHIGQLELDPDTWSPMLKDYAEGNFDISVRDLMKYSLTVSDNNASNLLFKHIVTPAETDAYIRSIANDTTFRIRYSEEEMKRDHFLAYFNYTSPLAAASLIKQIFENSMTVSAALDSIRKDLTTVSTGQDRLGAILKEQPELFFAHKTGSGFRNEAGELAAHNDVGYFRLPDGRGYALAVLVRDFSGSESEASAVIAKISRIIYDFFISQSLD